MDNHMPGSFSLDSVGSRFSASPDSRLFPLARPPAFRTQGSLCQDGYQMRYHMLLSYRVLSWPILSVTFLVSLWLSGVAFSAPVQIGQSVTLHAQKSQGVPLHREANPSYWKHVPDRMTGTVSHINPENGWLFLSLESGEQGWVHPKYVRATDDKTSVRSPPEPPDHQHSSTEESRVWGSRKECLTAVNRGTRLGRSPEKVLRLVTWNLRWFPTGQSPDHQDSTITKTDLRWLACTIVWMQADILVVEESLNTIEAKQAWEKVIESLEATTGNSWRWSPQLCGKPEGHHVGFLWNSHRVDLSNVNSLWSFNIKAPSAKAPCAGGLRPGHYARVQSRDQNGVNFHLIGLHLKSGPTVFALEDRQKALNRIDQNVAPLVGQDRDVIIVGDLNTMGAGDSASRKSELKYVRRMVTKEKPGFHDLRITPQCTHYFRGERRLVRPYPCVTGYGRSTHDGRSGFRILRNRRLQEDSRRISCGIPISVRSLPGDPGYSGSR